MFPNCVLQYSFSEHAWSPHCTLRCKASPASATPAAAATNNRHQTTLMSDQILSAAAAAEKHDSRTHTRRALRQRAALSLAFRKSTLDSATAACKPSARPSHLPPRRTFAGHTAGERGHTGIFHRVLERARCGASFLNA